MCDIYFFKKKFWKKNLPIKVNALVIKVPLFHINYQHIITSINFWQTKFKKIVSWAKTGNQEKKGFIKNKNI